MTNKNQYGKGLISRYLVNSLILMITSGILSQSCKRTPEQPLPEKAQPAPAAAVSSTVSSSPPTSRDLPSDKFYRLEYEYVPNSPPSRVKYPTDAIVLVDNASIFNDAGKRVGELNAGLNVEVQGIYDTLIMTDYNYDFYYRLGDNKIICSRDILLRPFSESSAGSQGAKVQIISNPFGYNEESDCFEYELWLKAGGSYKRLGETYVENGAFSVSSSGKYFFIKKYEHSEITVFASTGDLLWGVGKRYFRGKFHLFGLTIPCLCADGPTTTVYIP